MCLEYSYILSTHQRLHDGVVGSIHVGVQRKGTFSVTVVGCVAVRRNDPVLRDTSKSACFVKNKSAFLSKCLCSVVLKLNRGKFGKSAIFKDIRVLVLFYFYICCLL